MPWLTSKSAPALIKVTTPARVSTGDFKISPTASSGAFFSVTLSTVAIMVFASFLLILSSYASSLTKPSGTVNSVVVFKLSSVVRPFGLVIRFTVSPFTSFTPLKAAAPKVTSFTFVPLLSLTVSMVSLFAMSEGRKKFMFWNPRTAPVVTPLAAIFSVLPVTCPSAFAT